MQMELHNIETCDFLRLFINFAVYLFLFIIIQF